MRLREQLSAISTATTNFVFNKSFVHQPYVGDLPDQLQVSFPQYVSQYLSTGARCYILPNIIGIQAPPHTGNKQDIAFKQARYPGSINNVRDYLLWAIIMTQRSRHCINPCTKILWPLRTCLTTTPPLLISSYLPTLSTTNISIALTSLLASSIQPTQVKPERLVQCLLQ